jgi:hypothetical protein
MRIEDAPPPGWYPDPEGGSRLRWWEGTDWADRWRAPPTVGVRKMQEVASEQAREEFDQVGGYVGMPGMSRRDSEEIISQVRQAARAEAERAAQLFGDQARRVTNQITPLVTQYTNKFIKWFRIVAVIGIIIGIAWVAWQIFVQVSLFEWIGDRIDNLTDNDDESGTAAVVLSAFW